MQQKTVFEVLVKDFDVMQSHAVSNNLSGSHNQIQIIIIDGIFKGL